MFSVQKLTLFCAMGLLLFIAAATLSPPASRPFLAGPNEAHIFVFVERIGAYAILGGLTYFGLGRRVALAAVLVVTVAISLEVLQFVRPGRDPGVFDALQKTFGGLVGICLVRWGEYRMRSFGRLSE